MNSFERNIIPSKKQQMYQCPCGKSYQSKGAVYTHIKHKHNGVPPGQVKKPLDLGRKRGRPAIKKQKVNEIDKEISFEGTEIDEWMEDISEKNRKQKKNNIYYLAYQKLFKHLAQIDRYQPINPQIWNKIDAFKQMEEFIDSRNAHKKCSIISIGAGILQFLKQLFQGLCGCDEKLQQIMVLLILLVQYAIDQSNTTSIIKQSPIEQIVSLMNPFMNDHIKDLAVCLQIENLWVMEQENMEMVFVCFYNWMKWKNYTQYCITLI